MPHTNRVIPQINNNGVSYKSFLQISLKMIARGTFLIRNIQEEAFWEQN